MPAAAGAGQVADAPAGVADARVGEGLDEARGGVGLPHGVGVGEGEQLTARALDGGILRAHLAAARQLEHEVGAGAPRELRGLIAAAVAGDDHLEQLARVVERERVLHALSDHLLLVVRGDDQREGRAGRLAPAGERARSAARGAAAR